MIKSDLFNAQNILNVLNLIFLKDYNFMSNEFLIFQSKLRWKLDWNKFIFIKNVDLVRPINALRSHSISLKIGILIRGAYGLCYFYVLLVYKAWFYFMITYKIFYNLMKFYAPWMMYIATRNATVFIIKRVICL